MPKIERLEPRLAHLIKSGVIITDVSDAVRELVQNSVDSGAQNVDVVIGNGTGAGSNTIDLKVIDDGNGISPNDLEVAGMRYFTSKLNDFDQLKSVETLGFRGEALNSLISVSNVMIVSKVPEYNGSFRVFFTDNKRSDVKIIEEDSTYYGQIKSKSGTIVHATHMFENIPVRKLFINSITESKFLNEIRKTVFQCCIINPHLTITVRLAVNSTSKLVCKVDLSNAHDDFQSLVSRSIDSIFGIKLSGNSNFLQVSYKNYKVESVVGLLPVQTKLHQYIFYNQRYVNDERLLQNVNRLFNDSGFGESVDNILVSSISRNDTSPKKGQKPTKTATSTGKPYKLHPIFVIKITGPSSTSHLIQEPSKVIIDLKFFDIINPLIHKLITQFLKLHHYKNSNSTTKMPTPVENDNIMENKKKSLMVVLSSSKLRFGKTSDKELSGMINVKTDADVRVTSNPSRTNSIDTKMLQRKGFTQSGGNSCDHNEDIEPLELEKSITRDTLLNCKIISQIDAKFILIKHETSLYVIDQHACDERIKLERNIQDYISEVNDPFCETGLNLNDEKITFNITLTEIDLFLSYKEQCSKWGIKYEINANTITITHLPKLLMKKLDDRGTFIKRCILQYLFDLNSKVKTTHISKDWWLAIQSIPSILIELMNSNACRDAIMFGHKLSKGECEILIKDLIKCKNPFYCAHGRPSIVPIYNIKDITKT